MSNPIAICQRCHGDLCLQHDQWGDYLECLQCGAEHDIFGNLSPRRDPVVEGIAGDYRLNGDKRDKANG